MSYSYSLYKSNSEWELTAVAVIPALGRLKKENYSRQI